MIIKYNFSIMNCINIEDKKKTTYKTDYLKNHFIEKNSFSLKKVLITLFLFPNLAKSTNVRYDRTYLTTFPKKMLQ